MVAMVPFVVLSMMVYLAFESVGILTVVADIALNDINAMTTNKTFFMSLPPSVNDWVILANFEAFSLTKGDDITIGFGNNNFGVP